MSKTDLKKLQYLEYIHALWHNWSHKPKLPQDVADALVEGCSFEDWTTSVKSYIQK